jgi:putative NADH-flavin reductase
MIGQRVAAEATARGHSVTALVRDPSKVPDEPLLHAVATNALDPASLADAVAGHDAVFSAYGPGSGDPEQLVSLARVLIDSLPRAGVRRLVVAGGAGSLEIAPGHRLVDSPDFPPAWKELALAHARALDVLRTDAGVLDWTYFSPAAIIEPGERTGVFRVGGDQLLVDAAGVSRISAEDFSIAVVDELEQPRHVRQRVTVAY